MKKLLCIIAILIATTPVFSAVVPVTFWFIYTGSSSTPPPPITLAQYQNVSKAMCELNANHSNNVFNGSAAPTGIYFYTSGIRSGYATGISGVNLLSNFLNVYPKAFGLNIYVHSMFFNSFGSPASYDPTNDVIKIFTMAGAGTSTELTHEIGHYLNLGHTTNGSWMDQGISSGYFDPGQTSTMVGTCLGKGFFGNFPVNGTITPFPVISGGSVSFYLPGAGNNCSLPYRVDIKQYTYCPSTSPEYIYNYSNYNLNIPTAINIGQGVRKIDYTYYFPNPGIPATLTQTITYNIPADPQRSYCSVGGGSGRMYMNTADETSIKKFDIVNTVVESDLVISSSQVKTATIVDYTGRSVMHFKINSGNERFNLDDLSAGLYWIIPDGDKAFSKKFVKH